MKSNKQLGYEIGHKVGLDAIDALALKTEEPAPIHFVGALTALLQCILFFDKDKKRVMELINVSLETAQEENAKQETENASRFKGKRND